MKMNGTAMEQALQKTGVIVALATLANLLWGSAPASIKIGYRLFEIAAEETATQILFAGLRFTLAGVLTVILGSLLGGGTMKPSKKSWPKIVVLAMLQTVVQYTFYYIGVAHTTGVKAAILNPMNVFAGILISSLIFRLEKLTPRKLAGCLIGFAGVVLINVTPGSLDLELTLFGEGFVLLAAVTYSFSYVVMKLFATNEDPVMLSGYQFMVGGVIMVILGLAAGGQLTVISGAGLLVLLYLGLVSAVAYGLWSLLLKYNPVSKISVFTFLNPVFGVLLSSLLLGEGSSFGVKGLIALGLASVGIVIVNRSKA